MNVRLKPELQKSVDDEVKAGNFASADEVIEAGLARLMLDPASGEVDAETLAAIDEAEAQIDRGEGLSLDDAFARLRKKHLPE
jgi:Arc/MetJ-type ribon-helix-helix transcriptional regulator